MRNSNENCFSYFHKHKISRTSVEIRRQVEKVKPIANSIKSLLESDSDLSGSDLDSDLSCDNSHINMKSRTLKEIINMLI